MSKVVFMKSVAVAALFFVSGASFAGPTLYTTQAGFNTATTARGVDTFNDLLPIGPLGSQLNRSAGGYAYTATVEHDFWTAGFRSSGDMALTTGYAVDPMKFSGFAAGVNAIGGNFFDTDGVGHWDNNGVPVGLGDIIVTATDSTGSTSYTILGATYKSFLGFVSSTDSMTSLVVTAVQPANDFVWPTANNLVLGKSVSVAAVPEPETYALMLAGLGLLGFIARRRKGTSAL